MSTIEFNQNLNFLTDSLNAFAYSLTKNMEDARDLYQETAFRALNNKEKFRPETNFKAWTFTIMKNIFINNYRKKVKANTFLDSTENGFFIDGSLNNSNYNDGAKNILMDELGNMISQLEDSIKIPFMLHHDGYKYNEISEMFDLPLGTVKSRIFFARKALKKKIKARYGDYDTVKSMIA